MISVGNVVMNIENKRIIHRFTILDHFETRVDGILGSDFLTKNSACIDYARRTIEFYYQNSLITVELAGEKTNTLTIPLRCEITYYCQVRETNEFLIMTEEVSKGVLVASSINRPTNG